MNPIHMPGVRSNFAELDGELRMALRAALEREGYEIESYSGGCVSVACPRVRKPGDMQRLARCGLFPVGKGYYFAMRTGQSEAWRESHGHPDSFYGTGSRAGFELFQSFGFFPLETEGL